MRTRFLPFAIPDLSEMEFQEVREALESGWITMGPKVFQFEQEFSQYVGSKHAVAVNSCTAALHLALEAIDVRRGDLVVTSPYTFAATAEVIRYFGATPVFVDVEPDTMNLDPKCLRLTLRELSRVIGVSPKSANISRILRNSRLAGYDADEHRPLVKAIIPVHFAGHPCEMDQILELAAEFGVAVIEDAAHSLPASFKGQIIGSAPLGPVPRAVCFSFYATKTLTTGEGGMIATDSDAIAESCRRSRLHGISRDAWNRYSVNGDWYYEVTAIGHKYNMTDIHAGMGISQLRRLREMWHRRLEIAKAYDAAFGQEPAVEIPTVRDYVEHSWHLYPLRLNLSQLKIDRRQFLLELKRRKIGASVHFIPLHLHPYYRKAYGYLPDDFPVALQEYNREVSLPIYSKMNDQDAEDVIDAVASVIQKHSVRQQVAVS